MISSSPPRIYSNPNPNPNPDPNPNPNPNPSPNPDLSLTQGFTSLGSNPRKGPPHRPHRLTALIPLSPYPLIPRSSTPSAPPYSPYPLIPSSQGPPHRPHRLTARSVPTARRVLPNTRAQRFGGCAAAGTGRAMGGALPTAPLPDLQSDPRPQRGHLYGGGGPPCFLKPSPPVPMFPKIARGFSE